MDDPLSPGLREELVTDQLSAELLKLDPQPLLLQPAPTPPKQLQIGALNILCGKRDQYG